MIFTNSGYMAFHDTSAAGNATITSTASLDLASSGSTKFFNSSNAGNGTFILEGGVLGSGGVAVFNDDSSAANGTFTVGGVMGSGGGGANLYFLGNSSTGSGNFTVNGNQFVDADPLRGFVCFFRTAVRTIRSSRSTAAWSTAH